MSNNSCYFATSNTFSKIYRSTQGFLLLWNAIKCFTKLKWKRNLELFFLVSYPFLVWWPGGIHLSIINKYFNPDPHVFSPKKSSLTSKLTLTGNSPSHRSRPLYGFDRAELYQFHGLHKAKFTNKFKRLLDLSVSNRSMVWGFFPFTWIFV